MKKAITMIMALVTVLSLAACGVMPEEVITVSTDAERIVEIATVADTTIPTAQQAPQPPEIEYAADHYTYSTTAADGMLTILADAKVTFPVSLQLPLARVRAVGFTQEQASAYFRYFFEEEQPIVYNRGAVTTTKQVLRDLIALYEQQIANGTIMEQNQLSEEEAREEIKRLEAQIPDAPDSAPPVELSDGTMLPSVRMHYDDAEPLLALDAAILSTEQGAKNYARESLYIYTPVNANDHAEAHFFYDRREAEDYYEATATALKPNTSIEGISTTWDDALTLCKEFFAVGGVTDMTVTEAFRLDKDGDSAYRLHFSRNVSGIPLAVNHEGCQYKGVATPWDYESCVITIDDKGIYDVGWACPTETTEIIKPTATAMSFAQAAEIFEAMATEVYKVESVRYDGKQWDYEVTINEIQLSLLRIRDVSTDERVGLYVPAWVFYGKTMIEDSPTKNWEPQIVFAINAIDGSIIDIDMGY